MTQAKLLLFDLGGVLVEFAAMEGLRSILTEALTPEQIRARWDARDKSDMYRRFESGQISALQFAEAFCSYWPVRLPPDEFLTEFRSWSKSLYPGAAELLGRLRPRFRLAALSNSNEIHWDRNCGELGVDLLFERAFSSHLLGACKPDPAIYEHALRELAVAPQDVVFFDDLEVNVEAARLLGMAAHQVRGVPALSACLSELGFLTSGAFSE